MTIPEAVRQLLAIVDRLRAEYPKKRFTLDGRLVGDIGEVIAAQEYDIVLHEGTDEAPRCDSQRWTSRADQDNDAERGDVPGGSHARLCTGAQDPQ